MFRIRNVVFTFICIFFSSLVNPYITGGTLIMILIICKNKLKLLNFLFFVGMATFLISVLKSMYRDPRPYMVNEEITPLESYAEYGNPSGHTSIGYIIMSYIFEEFFYKRKLYIESPKNEPKRERIIKGIHVFVMFMIALSRVYLCMHSLDQVLYGLLIGAYLHFIYNLCLQRKIHRFLIYLLKKDFQGASKTQILILSLAIHSIMMLISLFLLEYDKEFMIENDKYEYLILKDLPNTPQAKILFNKTFVDNGIIALCFGVIYSLLFTPNQFKEEAEMCADDEYSYFSLKNLKRVLIIIILSLTLYILPKLISGENIYLLFILKMQLFFILVMAFYTCLMPQLFNFVHITCETDFLQRKIEGRLNSNVEQYLEEFNKTNKEDDSIDSDIKIELDNTQDFAL